MRRVWPDGRFQDAEEQQWRALSDPWVLVRGAASSEFFIFRNRLIAEAWDRGEVPEERSTMLHFLIEPPTDSETGWSQVTLVCDERTERIDRLIEDLKATFQSLFTSALAVAGTP